MNRSFRTPTKGPRHLALTMAAVIGVAVASVGCTDLGQAGVLSARKSFRVPVEGIEVVPPAANLPGLVGDDELAAAVALVASPEELAALEASGTSLYDLETVSAYVPEEELRPGIEAAVILGLQRQIQEDADASIGDDGTIVFETDFAAWEAWELDFVDPDTSIEHALFTYPIVYRITVEAESLAELLGAGDEGGEGGSGGDAPDQVEDLADSDLVRRLFVRELGLRTLASDEVTPEDGWGSDEEEDAAHTALRDETRLDGCTDDQVPLDKNLYARLVVQSLDDPFLFATLGELSLTGEPGVCGILIDTDDGKNIKPFFDGGIRLTAELRMAMGGSSFHLGGYVWAGVEARVALPGSVEELGEL